MRYDLFISHASEDKEAIARPLAEELGRRGFAVWYDDVTLRLGDSLRQSIDRGLADSRFGVVILSPSFFAKPWPRRELDGLITRELVESAKLVLPVWHDVDHAFVTTYSPPLADKLAVKSAAGIDHIATEIESVLTAATEEPRDRDTGTRQTRSGLVRSSLIPTPDEVRSAERDAALAQAVTRGDELYIVMDLGGTKAYVSVMTRNSERLYDKKFATKSHNDADGLLEFIRRCLRSPIDRIHELTGMRVADVHHRLKAIGIAFPGATDFDEGLVLAASNFHITNFPLAAKVSSTFDVPIFVDNDVNLGIWGEAWKGAARGYANVVGIMIGTGIGGGIIINDQIHRGRHKTAGELGHIILDLNSDLVCGCKQRGCFEVLASRQAIARDLHNLKWERGNRDDMWAETTLLSNEIAHHYKQGDADAVAVVKEAGTACGKAVVSILNLLNPEIIVFNGGFVQQLGDVFLEPILAEAATCMNAIYRRGDDTIPIVVGQLSNPVLFGACRMAIDGSGGTARRSRQDILAVVGAGLSPHDRKLLDEIYRHPGTAPISGPPESPYSKEKLRRLRDRGLVRTEKGESFRLSTAVEITDLGRIVVEEILRPEV